MPVKKPPDVIRWMFENWNSLGVFTGDLKINGVNSLQKRYSVDGIAGCETQADWRFAPEARKFHRLFGHGEETRSAVGFNCAGEKKLRDQPGGTAMMTIGRLSVSVLDTGVDYENLGRWSWILVGGPRKRTRYVVLYQPCSSHNSAGNSVFAQQEDYFERRGAAISP